MIAQIKLRRGTTAEWAAANPVVLAAGEPGYDSTLKRLKIGDGTTAWASLPWTDYGTNPNLLHNWDFRNPVNQRGSGNATSAVGEHFLDRWKLYGTINNYVTSSKYIAITASSSIQQRIEGVDLAGKVCTVSWTSDNDTLYQLTGEFPSVAGTYNNYTFSTNNSLRFGYSASGYMYLQFYSVTSTTGIRTIKLELGTVSTLAYDPPMDYGTELLKCQRYFISMPAFLVCYGYTTSTTTATFVIPMPVTMRITPTFSITAFTLRYGGTIQPSTTSTVSRYPNGLRFSVAGTDFITNQSAAGYFQNIQEISADL